MADAGTGPVIYIVYYSLYGHIRKVRAAQPARVVDVLIQRHIQMADEVKVGLEKGGATVKLWQVAETLPEEGTSKLF